MTSPLLVLDDALASVDNNTAAEILASVRRQTQRTIVMISHQLSAAAACDRILVMEQGRLVQQGHHNELITIKGPYRSLWEREQAAERIDAVA
jgi:ATP-binding cassette subfamily B protein